MPQKVEPEAANGPDDNSSSPKFKRNWVRRRSGVFAPPLQRRSFNAEQGEEALFGGDGGGLEAEPAFNVELVTGEMNELAGALGLSLDRFTAMVVAAKDRYGQNPAAHTHQAWQNDAPRSSGTNTPQYGAPYSPAPSPPPPPGSVAETAIGAGDRDDAGPIALPRFRTRTESQRPESVTSIDPTDELGYASSDGEDDPSRNPKCKLGLRQSPSKVYVQPPHRNMIDDGLYWFFRASVTKFCFAALVGYTATALFFALLFMACEGGISNSEDYPSFRDAFFFSVQTLSTIGYGTLSPDSRAADLVVFIESFIGLVFTALATGMLYARVSHPVSRIRFSDIAVVQSMWDGRSRLVIRLTNERFRSPLLEVNARMLALVQVGNVRMIQELKLSRDTEPVLEGSWTLRHAIDFESPLHGLTKANIKQRLSFIQVFFTGQDSATDSPMNANRFYFPGDIKFGAKFKSNVAYNERKNRFDVISMANETIADARSSRFGRYCLTPCAECTVLKAFVADALLTEQPLKLGVKAREHMHKIVEGEFPKMISHSSVGVAEERRLLLKKLPLFYRTYPDAAAQAAATEVPE